MRPQRVPRRIIQEGDVVLIAGAGPIGLLHLNVAQLRRPEAVVVSEPSRERREQARDWGADHVIDPLTDDLPAFIANLTDGRGADAIIVAAPPLKRRNSRSFWLLRVVASTSSADYPAAGRT